MADGSKEMYELAKLLIAGIMEEDGDRAWELASMAEDLALSLTEKEVDWAKNNAREFVRHISYVPSQTIH